MLYLIQDLLYQHFHEEALIHTIERLGLQHEIISIKPFIDDIFFKTNRKDVLIFGAVKAAHLAKKYEWTPGSFYNDNHDYTIYSKYYKNNMLNWDSKIQKVVDVIEWGNDPLFIRPTGYTKLFKGQVFENIKDWEESLAHFMGNCQNPNPNEMIQISYCKNILQEVRCFIVKGKVITASMYKLGQKVLYKECTDDDILQYANDMCNIYQPADAFVMDICRTNNGLKIVECNCINCCGFYDIDIQKLIISLEENF